MADSKPRYDEDLLSILAHDLRTPISSAKNFIELARQLGPLTDKQDEYIGKGLNALARMETLINDVSDMRRLSRDVPLSLEPCDLRLLIGEAVSFLEGAAHGVTTTTKMPDDLPEIPVDPNLMRQLLNNLIGNAIKYNREDGQVHITATEVDDYVQFTVQDTGYGIPADELEHIFEPFYRARNLTGRRIAGSGLGLAIVKLIVDKHNGEITVASTVDVGTTFTVKLPKTQPQTA